MPLRWLHSLLQALETAIAALLQPLQWSNSSLFFFLLSLLRNTEIRETVHLGQLVILQLNDAHCIANYPEEDDINVYLATTVNMIY